MIDYDIEHCFQHYFSHAAAGSVPIHAFPQFLSPVLHTVFFPGHWLFFNKTIVQTTVSSEREMNFVAIKALAQLGIQQANSGSQVMFNTKLATRVPEI